MERVLGLGTDPPIAAIFAQILSLTFPHERFGLRYLFSPFLVLVEDLRPNPSFFFSFFFVFFFDLPLGFSLLVPGFFARHVPLRVFAFFLALVFSHPAFIFCSSACDLPFCSSAANLFFSPLSSLFLDNGSGPWAAVFFFRTLTNGPQRAPVFFFYLFVRHYFQFFCFGFLLVVSGSPTPPSSLRTVLHFAPLVGMALLFFF